MKHLTRFNESKKDELQNIEDNFQYINDLFGKPDIKSDKWGEKHKWVFTWDIDFNFTIKNDVSSTIEKLNKIINELEDIIAAKDRLIDDYNLQMSLTDKLVVDVTPNETGNNSYNFIKGGEWRAIFISISEVERFFKSNGFNIVKIKNDYIDGMETQDLVIYLDKITRSIFDDFNKLIIDELDECYKNNKLDRKFELYREGTKIVMYPENEKTYIVAK